MKKTALSHRLWYVRFQIWIFFVSCLVLSACSTLPERAAQVPQLHTDIATHETTLASIIDPLRQQNEGLTGYHVLDEPLEALAARLKLIEKAEKSLDLQYYIWENDKIGAMALHELIRAANRGVKIRLLIDDHNSQKMEGIYLALDQHQNISVRLYNPFGFRQLRAMDFILDLNRVNRRMHNKSFIADHRIALIGGRNMSNQYFYTSDRYQFADVDVLLVGDAASEISDSFDEYWNDEYAYPVQGLVDPQRHTLRFESLNKQLDDYYKEISVQNYLDLANRSQDFERWLHYDIRFSWVTAHVLKDSPAKIRNQSSPEQYLNQQLLKKLSAPSTHLDIISAYFVPEEQGAQRLADIAQNGVKVRVLTNSFIANDVPIVHAFYGQYRKDLLDNGVELYEFLATPEQAYLNTNTWALARKTNVNPRALSRSSLHTKLMAVDHEQVFIGSFNFDPRSAYLNTEIGVLLNSPTLATSIHETMDQDIHKYAYELILDADKKLRWKFERHNGEKEIYKKEPDIKWWEKLGLSLIRWLPIEKWM